MLIMNRLGKKDGRIFGTDMRLEPHNLSWQLMAPVSFYAPDAL